MFIRRTLFLAVTAILPPVLHAQATPAPSAQKAPAPKANAAPAKDNPADWPTNARDLAGTRYTPLTQINTSNVSKLTLAWSYRIAGTGGSAGPIVTAGGLVFIGATSDNRFRAFDAKTGKELWVTKVERAANANPMSYQGKNGKQYVAVIATDSVYVYALP